MGNCVVLDMSNLHGSRLPQVQIPLLDPFDIITYIGDVACLLNLVGMFS